MLEPRLHRLRQVLAGLLLVGWLAGAAPMVGAQVSTPTPIAGRTTPYGVVREPSFTPLPAATAESGFYDGGAYRIEVPSAWNGALVLFAHGYRGEGPDIFVTDSPIREHLIDNGYAWAASSYRGNSYRPDWGVDDTLALRDIFIQRHGAPRWTILHGQSMGGHVLVASLEQHPDVYQAALSECGVMTGIGEFDFLAAYTAAADYLSGVGLLDAPDPAAFGALVEQQWLPAMGTPGAYTPRGERFDSVVKYLTGGDLPFREQGLAQFYTRDLSPFGDPASAPSGSPASRALSTRAVTFEIDPGLGVSAAQLNADVRRFDPAPGARSLSEDPVFADFTGQISVPLLSIHNTGDGFVPFKHEQEYRRKTLAAGAADLLVQRAVRRAGHCNFTTDERSRAFDDLVAWLENGTRPLGENVLTSDLAHLGIQWTTPPEPDDPLSPAK
ncbi:MAG: S9 family peptidase [Chloroflexota bacterium]|nr:S9 family peptidase [Chloroflexota bacterium]